MHTNTLARTSCRVLNASLDTSECRAGLLAGAFTAAVLTPQWLLAVCCRIHTDLCNGNVQISATWRIPAQSRGASLDRALLGQLEYRIALLLAGYPLEDLLPPPVPTRNERAPALRCPSPKAERALVPAHRARNVSRLLRNSVVSPIFSV